MAEGSLRDGVKEVADQARPSQINPKLEEAVQNQPLLPHLLSFRVVLTAVAIAAVVALLLFLLLSPLLAALALVVVFFGAWFGLATRSYARGDRTGLEKDVEVKDASDRDTSEEENKDA